MRKSGSLTTLHACPGSFCTLSPPIFNKHGYYEHRVSGFRLSVQNARPPP